MELSTIIGHCEHSAHSVLQGNADPLTTLAHLRAIVGAAQDAIADIEPSVLIQAQTYHEKTFTHQGLKFTRTEGKRMFKFDHIEQWSKTKEVLDNIQERAKNASLQLESGLLAVTQDGEVMEPAKITYGKASISVGK